MHKGINSTLDEGQTPIVTHTLRGEGFDASEDGTGRGTPLVPVMGFYPTNRQPEFGNYENVSPAVKVGSSSGGNPPGICPSLGVRRLTPTECERLQGFPDDYTRIPWRNKAADQCPDGNRYKALGNSMAVPVMAWIGSRIQQVDRIAA